MDAHIYIYIYTFCIYLSMYIYTIYLYTFYIYLCMYIYTWRRQWQPTPVLLPGQSHWRRSLVGCSPGGREEPNTTVRLHFHFSLSCIREGNDNPPQCSCLENPRAGGARWAVVYGVAQSRTWLKWLSSTIYTYIIYIIFLWLCVWCVCVITEM